MFHELNIVGTIGREPELRYSADGKAQCSFSVASNRNLGNGKKETIWFKVTAFEKQAENVSNYAHKGMKILVIGRLVCNEQGSPRTYTKKDGTIGATFEVVIKEFQIIDFKADGQNQQNQQIPQNGYQQNQYQQRQAPAQQSQVTQQKTFVQNDDEIPF